MKKSKKKHKIDVNRLSAGQVQFIMGKVIELGSVAAVNRFYNKGDTVGHFARQVARSIFGPV